MMIVSFFLRDSTSMGHRGSHGVREFANGSERERTDLSRRFFTSLKNLTDDEMRGQEIP